MAKQVVSRTDEDIAKIERKGNHRDSRKAGWFAIRKGSEVIKEIQLWSPRMRSWESLENAEESLNKQARRILKMRLEAIHALKRAPHHAKGFRMSRHTGAEEPRPVTALCLISGNKGQEIPGLVAHDRVVVDAEHMEQALGPATVFEIFRIRKKIGEHVYISTNVSETPQIVRNLKTGKVDTRATAALTASKVIAAIEGGADVVKVGFAHLDPTKRDLPSEEVIHQMRLVREYVDKAVDERLMVIPLNQTGSYPLVSVFFPEVGIDSMGERPIEIAEKAIEITAQGGWQGVLIDTYEKFTGKTYQSYYTLEDTRKLAAMAHHPERRRNLLDLKRPSQQKLEFWIAGSIAQEEVPDLIRCNVDLICFGGAARHRSARRTEKVAGKRDQSIKRPLVTQLVRAFERYDRRQRGGRWPYPVPPNPRTL